MPGRPAGRPAERPAERPTERPATYPPHPLGWLGVWSCSVLQLYPLGSSFARGLVRSAGLIILGSKIALFSIFSIFFRFFGLPNNALKFASKK